MGQAVHFIGRACGKEAFKLTELGGYPLSLVDGLPVANNVRTWQHNRWIVTTTSHNVNLKQIDSRSLRKMGVDRA